MISADIIYHHFLFYPDCLLLLISAIFLDEVGLSSFHYPGYFLPSTINTPLPYLFPSTHSPSNLLLSLVINLP